MGACDVVALPYVDNPLIKYGNSCKTAEYLSCGIPVVSTKVDNILENYPEIGDVLLEAICAPGDVESMKSAIRFQVKNQICASLPKSILWQSLATKLEAAYRSLSHE